MKTRLFVLVVSAAVAASVGVLWGVVRLRRLVAHLREAIARLEGPH